MSIIIQCQQQQAAMAALRYINSFNAAQLCPVQFPAVRQVSDFERKWLHHYEQLKKYKEKHGNFNISTKNKALYRWVYNQIYTYQLLKEGKSSLMTADCIRKLESINFPWINERTEERHDLWHKRFQELKDYMETHGNCNMSTRHGSLGPWISTQRYNYQSLKGGKSSLMTDDRIRKLESIGFCWSSKRRHDSGETYQHASNDGPENSKSGTNMLLS